jgi:hypothetical protein
MARIGTGEDTAKLRKLRLTVNKKIAALDIRIMGRFGGVQGNWGIVSN